MFLPSLIKCLENEVNMISKPGTSAAKTDDSYYPTEMLSKGERRQALALLAEQKLPEGSIFVMEPDKPAGFGVVPEAETDVDKKKIESEFSKLGVRERGAKIVDMFLENPDHSDWASIETVVLPGNASSPLGTAALGKTLANMYKRKVAGIVAGQGGFDLYMESASGMTMAPMGNILNAFNPLLELTARVNPPLATMYVDELIGAMPDAATLYALLKARLVDERFNNLKMIVSHSKGNWAVLVALLAFELELIDAAKNPSKEAIKVVTFSNPQPLPDMEKKMAEFFRYFQFFGEDDFLAHNCSARAWTYRLTKTAKLEAEKNWVFKVTDDPVELMVAGAGHHLSPNPSFKEHHMPIDEILPQIH